MNLIDRYIAEVGKHLPRKNRADIEAEIRSTLEDMLDERKQGEGPADEATVMALLKEYGSPREVAGKYKTHPYLIGPRLFPLFERVVKIIFAIVIGASVLGLGVNISETGLSGPEFVSVLGEWFGGLFSGLMAAFGNLVLVFAIIERTQAAAEFEKEFSDWDPKELQQEPDPDKIDLPDNIATIIFTVLGLLLLNLYPNLLVAGFFTNDTWVSFPILTETFFRFLPWINVMGLLQIVFSSFMLSQKNWTPVTRIVNILVDIASMILSIVILRTPGIFNITPDTLRSIGITEAADTLARLFAVIPTIIIIIVAVATAVEVGKSVLRLLYGKPRPPYPIAK
jgi:hypothetical protein